MTVIQDVPVDITPEAEQRVRMDTFTGRTEAVVDAFAKAGKALLFEGPIGFGKTAFFRNYAAKRGRPIYVFNVALQQAEDLAGHPRAVTKEIDGVEVEVTVKTMNEWLYHVLNKDRDAMILFDEIKNADRDRQAAFLTFMQDREVDGYKLPDTVTLLALCNPTDISANGFEFSGPAANRFCHLQWDFPHQEMIDLMQLSFGQTTPEHEQGLRQRVTSYLRENSTFLHRMPEDLEDRAKGWPSPRSWDNIIKVGALLPKNEAVLAHVMKGYVGDAATVDFLTWDQNNRVPSARDILGEFRDSERDTYPWDDAVSADTATVLRFCHNMVAAVAMDHSLFEAACSYLVVIKDRGFPSQAASVVTRLLSKEVRGEENDKFPVDMARAFNDQISAAMS